jgi:hypothetical protein
MQSATQTPLVAEITIDLATGIEHRLGHVQENQVEKKLG